MAKSQKDHFVPVTYLNKFCDSAKRNLLHTYAKDDREVVYTCSKPRKVCTERGGDENPYFEDTTILRDFLNELEPRWSDAVDRLINDHMDSDARYIVSGLIAYMSTWVPAVRKVFVSLMEDELKALRPMFAHHAESEIDDPIERRMLVEGLLDPNIIASVDPHFPRAIVLKNMVQLAGRLFEGNWMLCNAPEGQHFITSDNPAVKWHRDHNDFFGKTYLPLTPDWSVIILPNPDKPTVDVSALLPGDIETGEMSVEAFEELRELTIKCADRIVISSRHDECVMELAQRFRKWRLTNLHDTFPSGNGFLSLFRMRPLPSV